MAILAEYPWNGNQKCDPYWGIPRSHTLRHLRKWDQVGNL